MSEHIKQVGGDHYDAPKQHWDICDEHDIDGLAWCASKYVDRWRHKGTPVLDLEKAISYLQKMLALGRGARRTVPWDGLQTWYMIRRTHPVDQQIINKILGLGGKDQIEEAVGLLRATLQEFQAADV